jgi:hypothetical protein
MSEQSVRTGGCLCGAVRFEAQGAPTACNYCHCQMCRKASGAPVVAWAMYPIDKVKVSGPMKFYRSSEKAERGFCPNCGSAMMWRRVGREGGSAVTHVDLTTGCFDNAAGLQPATHIFMESAISWLHIHDTLPRHMTWPPKN